MFREFLQQKILWDRERKELHEEIYELQRTEQMWLNHGDAPDSRLNNKYTNYTVAITPYCIIIYT